MKASELQNERYTLILDSQDLDSLCEYFPILPREDITGAIVTVVDGEYNEVYLTESSRPYELNADYNPISYYQK